MMTAFYSVRLISYGFYQEVEMDKKTYEQAHEPGLPMSITLIILGVASIVIGYYMKDMVMGPGATYIDFGGSYAHHSIESEFIET